MCYATFSNYCANPKPRKNVKEISKKNCKLTLTRGKSQKAPPSHLLSKLHVILNHLNEETTTGTHVRDLKPA
jgi:hypothetical protein